MRNRLVISYPKLSLLNYIVCCSWLASISFGIHHVTVVQTISLNLCNYNF